jgi:hypothetical protein
MRRQNLKKIMVKLHVMSIIEITRVRMWISELCMGFLLGMCGITNQERCWLRCITSEPSVGRRSQYWNVGCRDATINRYDGAQDWLTRYLLLSVVTPFIKGFEVEMKARSEEAAEQSYQLSEKMFAEDGATAIFEFFRGCEPHSK